MNSPGTYELAIFDFDGTLVDTAPIWHAVHVETARQLGASDDELASFTFEEWRRRFDRMKMREIADALVREYVLDTDSTGFRVVRNNIWHDYVAGKNHSSRTCR